MQEYLLFTLRGPMQAWGTVAVGEVRPVASRPTRSGLLGLLAAALGIRRSEPEHLAALEAACRMAVRIDAPGSRLVDYHTVQAPQEKAKRVFRTRRDELVTMLDAEERPNTILSRREYMADAAFTACVWLVRECDWTLGAMREALLEPVFVPYLGRKSCPAGHPFMPSLVQADNAGAALAVYAPETGRPGPVWADADHGIAGEFDAYAVRDAVTDHTRRLFGVRQEFRIPAHAIGEDEPCS